MLGGASLEVLYNLENATYRVRGALIDPQALPALGLKPILGRDMTDADGALGAPPTFLMSDRMWNERFSRDPNVLGMTLKLNGTMRTLIAITPPRFLLHGADVFFPTTITASSTEALLGGSPTDPLDVWTYGRLKPGVTLQQAAADLEVIARNEARLYPDRYPAPFTITVMSLADAYTATSLKEMVYILAGAVLMLLMIACSNVANLLLARTTAREMELALRASLGASRARLMHRVLAESFVLAATGTAIGSFLAYVGIQWVKTAIPADALPSEMEIRFSGQALLATVGVAMLTTLLCGIAPALRASRGDLHGRLMSTGKGVGLRSGHGRLRTLLVAVQVTLAIVLLVGAGLMMRTLVRAPAHRRGTQPEERARRTICVSPESASHSGRANAVSSAGRPENQHGTEGRRGLTFGGRPTPARPELPADDPWDYSDGQMERRTRVRGRRLLSSGGSPTGQGTTAVANGRGRRAAGGRRQSQIRARLPWRFRPARADRLICGG